MNAFKNAGFDGLPSEMQTVIKQKITTDNKGTTNQILDGYKNLIEGNATLKNSDPGRKILDTINNKKKEIADFDANEVRTTNRFTPPPPSSRFVGDVDGGDIPTPIINGGYKVGDNPDFDSVFKLGIDGAGVKLTDSQIDTVRQAIWVATRDLKTINISNFQKNELYL
jgi:hypothetical protein